MRIDLYELREAAGSVRACMPLQNAARRIVSLGRLAGRSALARLAVAVAV